MHAQGMLLNNPVGIIFAGDNFELSGRLSRGPFHSLNRSNDLAAASDPDNPDKPGQLSLLGRPHCRDTLTSGQVRTTLFKELSGCPGVLLGCPSAGHE